MSYRYTEHSKARLSASKSPGCCSAVHEDDDHDDPDVDDDDDDGDNGYDAATTATTAAAAAADNDVSHQLANSR